MFACPAAAVPPASFAREDPTPRLMARGAAKPLTAAASAWREVHFAARTVAAEKNGDLRWALTLAQRDHTSAWGVRCRGERSLVFGGLPALGGERALVFGGLLALGVERSLVFGGLLALGVERSLVFGGLPALGAAASVPSALGPTLFPTCGGLAILLTGSPLPPPPGSLATFRAAVTGLGAGRSKELLAPLEQTMSLTRPTSPLTSTRIAAIWIWAQGSCELPTAKPRTRSPLYSAPRRQS